MANILSMFSAPLFIEHYVDYPTLNTCLEYVKSLECPDSDQFTQQTVDRYVLNHKEMEPIRKFAENCIHAYLYTIVDTQQKLKITQSWVNISTENTYHEHHRHPNSVLSGVFYLHTTQQSPSIVFNRPHTWAHQFRMDNGTNQFTNDFYYHPPFPGMMLLFPSEIYHSVPPNKSGDQRISLSFNTAVDGEMGKEENLNYFKV
jgi:uncharacterized protein (TIGR02466 family)